MKNRKLWIGAAAAMLFAQTSLAQDTGVIGPSPYDFTTREWMEPFAEEGFTWGGNSSVFVESQDRIFLLQRGETELPNPLPDEYTNFAGSMGWNVLRGRGRVWRNCIYIIIRCNVILVLREDA